VARPRIADHGDRLRYQRDGCRCPACTAANREYNRRYSRAHYARLRADPERYAAQLERDAERGRERYAAQTPGERTAAAVIRNRNRRLKRESDPAYDAKVRAAARDAKRRERARRG